MHLFVINSSITIEIPPNTLSYDVFIVDFVNYMVYYDLYGYNSPKRGGRSFYPDWWSELKSDGFGIEGRARQPYHRIHDLCPVAITPSRGGIPGYIGAYPRFDCTMGINGCPASVYKPLQTDGIQNGCTGVGVAIRIYPQRCRIALLQAASKICHQARLYHGVTR